MTDKCLQDATQDSSNGPPPDLRSLTDAERTQLENTERQATYQQSYQEQLRQRGCSGCGESIPLA